MRQQHDIVSPEQYRRHIGGLGDENPARRGAGDIDQIIADAVDGDEFQLGIRSDQDGRGTVKSVLSLARHIGPQEESHRLRSGLARTADSPKRRLEAGAAAPVSAGDKLEEEAPGRQSGHAGFSLASFPADGGALLRRRFPDPARHGQ
jgi:hypothetical protein